MSTRNHKFLALAISMLAVLLGMAGCSHRQRLAPWEVRLPFEKAGAPPEIVDKMLYRQPVSQEWIERFANSPEVLERLPGRRILLQNPAIPLETSVRLIREGYGSEYIFDAGFLTSHGAGSENVLNPRKPTIERTPIATEKLEAFFDFYDECEGVNWMGKEILPWILRNPNYPDAIYRRTWELYKKYRLTFFLVFPGFKKPFYRQTIPRLRSVCVNAQEFTMILDNPAVPEDVKEEIRDFLRKAEVPCPNTPEGARYIWGYLLKEDEIPSPDTPCPQCHWHRPSADKVNRPSPVPLL